MRELSPTLIVGANGGFGRLFRRELSARGVDIRGVDLQSAVDPGGIPYWQASAEALPPAAVDGVRWLILCVPEHVAISAVPGLATLGRECTVSDVASVKTPVAVAVSRVHLRCGWLSLHPMHSPTLSFDGRPMALVSMRTISGDAERPIREFIRAVGAKTVDVTSEEHDRVTAFLQAGTHATLMSLGMLLSDGGFPASLARALTTPINAGLMAMLARMTGEDPGVYADIQASNPFAAEVRIQLASALMDLNAKILQNDTEAVKTVLTRCRQALGNDVAWLERAAEAFARLLVERPEP